MEGNCIFMNKPLHKFLSNKKSALALIIFLLCVFFAVIGPYLTPYDYSYQYRNSINLKPLQFSDKENLIRSISPRPDLFYSASLQPGSITELSKGYYSFNYKTSEYYFSLERDLQDAVIVFYHEKNNPSLYIVKEGDIKNGTYIKKSDLKIISGYFEDAASLEMKSYVFPHNDTNNVRHKNIFDVRRLGSFYYDTNRFFIWGDLRILGRQNRFYHDAHSRCYLFYSGDNDHFDFTGGYQRAAKTTGKLLQSICCVTLQSIWNKPDQYYHYILMLLLGFNSKNNTRTSLKDSPA